MVRRAPPRRRALIVEDEFTIALDLENAMSALGFDVCGLASSDRTARSLAMSKDPDIVLMDVCLEGGREGIETARWLREVCGASVVSSRRVATRTPSSASASGYLERRFYRSYPIATGSLARLQRSASALLGRLSIDGLVIARH
jgi:CheY-like chemotaxis protein